MLKNYLMTALSVYRKRKMFTVINLMCIVLTLVVLLVVTAVLQESFYPTGAEHRSERVLHIDRVSLHGKADSVSGSGLGYKLIERYLRPMRTAEYVAAVTEPQAVTVFENEGMEQISIRYTDSTYWKILDFKVISGRTFSGDDVEKGRFVVVINRSTEKKLFGLESALGKTLNISSRQFVVIGVIDDEFHSYSNGELWVPLSTSPTSDYKNELTGMFSALIMTKTSTEIPALKEEVRQVAQNIVSDRPNEWGRMSMVAESNLETFARGFSDGSEEDLVSTHRVVLSIVVVMFLFMLLPAINLVNLNLGRMMERSSEIGVRKAFGASSLTLVAQFLVENILLSVLGCIIAFVLAQFFLYWLGNSGLIPYLKVSANLVVFLYGVVLTIIFGIVSGVVPAWRMSKLDPVQALKGRA